MKVCFETFGCRLNRAEALDDEAKYIARGWDVIRTHEDADLIVVRGCSVTARAQRDCEKLVEHIRLKYPNKRVIVTGCLPSADRSYKVRETPRGRELPVVGVQRQAPSVPTRTARAYLKMQDGCSGHCTFCIVPQFRGHATSVPVSDLVDKANRFIAAGYQEIVLTGCNLSQYNDAGRRLPDVLAALPEGCRYRLGSLEPSPVAHDILDVMAGRTDFCHFLHVPVQSGSDAILKAMARPYLIDDVDALLADAVAKLPVLGLGCDLIAGFPGENVIDHQATRRFLERHPFNNAHIFPYSRRPGTRAATLPLQLTHTVRHGRAHELSEIITQKRLTFAKTLLDKTVEVLVEDEKHQTGWSREYFACEIKSVTDRTFKRKTCVTARVTHVHEDRLTVVPA